MGKDAPTRAEMDELLVDLDQYEVECAELVRENRELRHHADALASELSSWVDWLKRVNADGDDLEYLNGRGWKDAGLYARVSRTVLANYTAATINGGAGD